MANGAGHSEGRSGPHVIEPLNVWPLGGPVQKRSIPDAANRTSGPDRCRMTHRLSTGCALLELPPSSRGRWAHHLVPLCLA